MASSDRTSDPLPGLRRQLILAQIQILTLEDEVEALRGRLAGSEDDAKELQRLLDARLEAEAVERRLRAELEQRVAALEAQRQAAEQHGRAAEERRRECAAALERSEAVAAAERKKREDSEAELHHIRSSRSWRWTAPLRAFTERTKRRPGT